MSDSPAATLVTIEVVYLARLREAFGMAAESVALPAETSHVAGLLALLRRRGGKWADELAAGRAVRVAVNQEMADFGTPIRNGDEVALFPPVTGG
jgi:molybdopterin synthase sulfur carrier subunit